VPFPFAGRITLVAIVNSNVLYANFLRCILSLLLLIIIVFIVEPFIRI
jgi:hypothetical protein